MATKIDNHYDSKSSASRIAQMSELVSTWYNSLNENISAHVDQLDGLVKQLKGIDTTLEEDLAMGMLVTSIHMAELLQVTQSIKTLSKCHINWEDIDKLLIEEAK